MDSNFVTAASHALNRHLPPADSRLLANLIKAERNYINHLRSSVTAAQTASASLSAWGTSEAPDIADTSARLGNLLAASADVQSTHVAAIEGYRAALKDVADREASIRTVVRDRDILVGRLVKASQKSANPSSKKSPEERAEKVAKAQRELSSCEQVLLSEEAALVGVKRRTFKEALTMRMKTMGDAGAAMVDAAKEAILLLNDFDSNANQLPYSPSYAEFGGAADGIDPSFQHQYMQDAYEQYPADDDEEGHYNQDGAPIATDHHNFENSSVTPSQSASQIYQPRATNRNPAFASPQAHQQRRENALAQRPENVEPDSDEEDWQESFNPSHVQHHPTADQGRSVNVNSVPAPHRLDPRAGAESDFVPEASLSQLPPPLSHAVPHPQQASPNVNGDIDDAPAPALPDKDADSRRVSLSMARNDPRGGERAPRQNAAPQRALNYVPMPPVPSAPRLDSNGITMPSVPTAPKMYLPSSHGTSQAQDDSSSDEDEGMGGRNTIAHRGGRSDWSMPSRQAAGQGDDSSDGGTAIGAGRAGSGARKGGFLGKMGRLFKSDEKEHGSVSQDADARPRRISNQWDTRTNTNLRHSQTVRDPSNLHRRSKILTGPLVPQEGDSSDDERVDERNLVRNVNQGPPLWQTPLTTNSDLGIGRNLINARPSSVKRTPSVTAGPMSWNAHQAAATPQATDIGPSGTIKKTKKKKSDAVKSTGSVDGGSEIGTQSTRTKPSASSAQPLSQRNSVIVHGDASSGIRRSDSLNYGSMRSTTNDRLAKRNSKRLSAMSTQQVHGYGNKAGAIVPGDPSGKFATTNWVAKSNVNEANGKEPEKPPPAAVAKPKAVKPATSANTSSKPVSRPKQQPLPQTTSQQHADGDNEPPKHVPQPSRTMSPPPKSALKGASSQGLARSGSLTGIAGLPVLPEPVTAPTRASILLEKQESQSGDGKTTPSHRLPLESNGNFDGTGSLNMPSTYDNSENAKAQGAPAVVRTPLPRIDMPASEPFKVDLDGAKKNQLTPQKEAGRHTYDSSPLLTPNERHAYNQFLDQQLGSESDAKGSGNADTLQPLGVSRTTVARASVGSGVLGPKNVPPPQAAAQAAKGEPAQSTGTPNDAASEFQQPGKLSRSYSGEGILSSESSDDEGATVRARRKEPKAQPTGQSVNPAEGPQGASEVKQTAAASSIKKPASILSNSHLQISGANDGAERSPEGSNVSRRKSVRMAPDVKLPPETPPGDVAGNRLSSSFSLPHKASSHSSHSTSQLSSRIAPPPPAPARVTVPVERPIDLGDLRERPAWNTRIGSTRKDDSSDEEDAGLGADEYASARRNFGSISRSWGKATRGPSASNKDETGSESVRSKGKKKKATSGYNPAIALPAGMEVVGRSAGRR